MNRELTKMSLLIAVLCISAYISIPIPFSPAPIVLTIMILALMSYVLNFKQTFIAIGIYLLLGAVGIPVFAGGKAGLAHLVGATGGYLLGYLIAFTLASYLKGSVYSFVRYAIVGLFVALPLVYGFGVVGLMLVLGIPFEKAFMIGVVPFIVFDIIKMIIAAWLAGKIRI